MDRPGCVVRPAVQKNHPLNSMPYRPLSWLFSLLTLPPSPPRLPAHESLRWSFVYLPDSPVNTRHKTHTHTRLTLKSGLLLFPERVRAIFLTLYFPLKSLSHPRLLFTHHNTAVRPLSTMPPPPSTTVCHQTGTQLPLHSLTRPAVDPSSDCSQST